MSQHIFEGKILDIKTDYPVANASIQILQTKIGTTSDSKGKFTIEFDAYPIVFVVKHIGFEEETITVTKKANDRPIVYLIPKSNLLEEVTVRAKNVPIAISEPEEYTISDFTLLENKVYRLEHHGIFEKYKVAVTDLTGKVESDLKLEKLKKIEGLYRSCHGEVYVLTATYAHPLIKDTKRKIQLGRKVSIDTFNLFIKPCKAVYQYKLYYQNKRFNELMSIISSYNIKTGERKKIRTIANENQISNYQNELGIILLSEDISNMEEISVKENTKIRDLQEEGDFLQYVFYKPEYPVFTVFANNQLFILNHAEKKLETYVQDEKVSEVELPYVGEKEWLRWITVDQITEKIYTLFDLKEGIGVKELNTRTGELKLISIIDTQVQNYKSVEISNGIVFYLKDAGPTNTTLELNKIKM